TDVSPTGAKRSGGIAWRQLKDCAAESLDISPDNKMTVLDVLQSTTAYFKKRGIENPRLSAEHLLAHSLGRKRLDIYLEFERDLAEPELAPLRELVRRRGPTPPPPHWLGPLAFS